MHQQDELEDFSTAKTALAEYTKLLYMQNKSKNQFTLIINAPNIAIGSVIGREIDSIKTPISSFSVKVSKT